MERVTVLSDEVHDVEAVFAGDRVLIEPRLLPSVLGWQLKPEGLCRDDVCVPVRDARTLLVGSRLDLTAAAGALGRPSVTDVDAGLVAIALPSEERTRALHGLRAPSFTLADLDGQPHTLAEWHGRKKLLVAFASW